MFRVIVLVCLSASIALGQSSQASISGVVADPQGAMIPGVEVIATEVDTGVKTTTRTNESGFYSLRPLPIGNYTVSAHMEGFRRHLREGINLTTGAGGGTEPDARARRGGRNGDGDSRGLRCSKRAMPTPASSSNRRASRTCRWATAAP